MSESASGHAPVIALSVADLIAHRQQHVGPTIKLAHAASTAGPLYLTHAQGARVYDSDGRCYIDAINNVCHVGHNNPTVNAALIQALQSSTINTNTKYLSSTLHDYISELLPLLDSDSNNTSEGVLDTVYFTNSGSEANDLALRIAAAYTGGSNVVCLDHAYHGATVATVRVSPYKFRDQANQPVPECTHVLSVPHTGTRSASDGSRDCDDGWARETRDVTAMLSAISSSDRKLSCFIHESFLSCAGQLPLPPRFLSSVYSAIRANHGLCIADEIQTGLGRNGQTWFEYQLHGVHPDIVTLGKCTGNGLALSVVVTTRKIASRFTGMEYYNTFAGNNLSLLAGLLTIREIKHHNLVSHARSMGQQCLERLRVLARNYPSMIGDVRGYGLMLGVECIECEKCLTPSALVAERICDYARSMMATDDSASIRDTRSASGRVDGVLLSTDGPHHNVIKIKPPMVVTRAELDCVVHIFDRALQWIKSKGANQCPRPCQASNRCNNAQSRSD